ncbi:MAG: Gfo/Idh/MocA family oxidoreductase [Planctomycetota bacterium]
MSKLKGVAVGAGYFSQFHFDAWNRIEDVELTAVCDVDFGLADEAKGKYRMELAYRDFDEMLDREKPDFVDIITRPDSHLELVQKAAARGIAIICQKALAPTYAEAKEIVRTATEAGVPFMVHENFRFQPWYREIRRQVDSGAIGDTLHHLGFRCRTGDGWGENAYLDRQPYFRDMPRLLVFETGVHFTDTFRFLAGEICGVYAQTKQLNSVIAGEDACIIMYEFSNGETAHWDANRYNEPNSPDARFTFGEALIEGSSGALRLYGDGKLTLQQLGQTETPLDYPLERRGFAGDCVYWTQRHFVENLVAGNDFETSGAEYLKTLAVVEAIYDSALTRAPVRWIDLQLNSESKNGSLQCE